MAFEEQELVRLEWREGGLPAGAGSQRAQIGYSAMAFAARQCDVRMIWPRFHGKSALAGGRNHLLLQRCEASSDGYIREEDASAVKKAQFAEFNGNRRGTNLSQPRRKTVKLLRRGAAQELQCNVP